MIGISPKHSIALSVTLVFVCSLVTDHGQSAEGNSTAGPEVGISVGLSSETTTAMEHELEAPALVEALAAWLVRELGLPRMKVAPKLMLAPVARMASLRDAETSGGRATSARQLTRSRADLVAVYDSRVRTIYLPLGWTGRTAVDQSILVHELVHHLQGEAGMRFACAEHREQAAFEAQSRWLERLGLSLEGAFGIDPLTLLVRTNCAL